MVSNAFLSRITVLAAFFLAIAGFTQAAPVARPAIPEVPASKIYQVRVDGIAVPVNDESHLDSHTAVFSIGKPVRVEVGFSDTAAFASIHPLRRGIEARIDGKKISFTLEKPLKLVIKSKGGKRLKPLALCATPLEENVPAADAKNVICFAPGVHTPGLIQPASGQTVYLAPGALVKGRIEVRDATGVTIYSDHSDWATCRNIRFENFLIDTHPVTTKWI